MRMSAGKQRTTIFRRPSSWIGGLVALLMLPASGAFSIKAESAELPVPAPLPAKEAAQPARQTHKVCVGMDGKSFPWDSANAPFASSCHIEEDKQPASPQPQPGAK